MANKITLARAALIPAVLLLLVFQEREATFGVFLLACAGDVLDGMVARRRCEVTTWGKALDPTVDKVLYVSLLIALTVLGETPITALILFLIPQVGLGIGALFLHLRHRLVQGAKRVGKAAALITFFSMTCLLLRCPYRVEILYAAIGVSYFAGLDYLSAALRTTGSHGKDRRETREGQPPQSASSCRSPGE